MVGVEEECGDSGRVSRAGLSARSSVCKNVDRNSLSAQRPPPSALSKLTQLTPSCALGPSLSASPILTSSSPSFPTNSHSSVGPDLGLIVRLLAITLDLLPPTLLSLECVILSWPLIRGSLPATEFWALLPRLR